LVISGEFPVIAEVSTDVWLSVMVSNLVM
jgi:hypothetical protein